MDNKRKATGAAGADIDGDGDDRASKRRKVPGPPSDYNLLEGETPESTTAYGLHFLETIRRTKDKSGRLVASYFEDLIPHEGNEEYYRRIRMPLSLKIIEQKLHNQEFKNLSELESYFKRMVTNAKEFYPKNSEIYEDAERVRKALSNYMTKTNPAYKLNPGYSCQAAPIPDDLASDAHAPAAIGRTQSSSGTNGKSRPTNSKVKKEPEAQEEDAEGDEDAQGDEEQAGGDSNDGEEEDDGPRKIVIRRRGTGRPTRGSTEPSKKHDKAGRVRADHEYEGVPYKGLTFQQAQEKIVEELIRKPDGPDPYFLDFINLPPRSYKDYFAVIQNPLSLKGLQKLVKGIHGRQPATGISDFKTWAQFEEKASLLWENAHFYNEEGSVIHKLATELKECFYKELNEAKAVVQEPPQPKIKLKMAPGQDGSTGTSKKITIHVGGSRGSATASPAPQTASSVDGSIDRSGTPAGSTAGASFDKGKLTGAAPSPSPAPGTAGQPSPAVTPRLNGSTPATINGANGMPSGQAQLQNGQSASSTGPLLYDSKYRAPGRGLADSLLPSVLIRTHPGVVMDRRFRVELPAHPKEAQQNISLHIPAAHHRLQLIPRLPPFEQQGRAYRVFVTINGQMVGRATPLPIPDDPLPRDAMVFEIGLGLTTNIIAVTVVASLPKGQKLPNGADCEVERMTIYAQLMRGY